MQIKLNSILVDDQAKALAFYTEILGFVKKQDIPAGEFRWLTVISPEGPEDVELVLEPNANAAARSYQQALHQQGIPLTAFSVTDVHQAFENLKQKGVLFHSEPMDLGAVIIAVLDDTCGNLIQIYQQK